jgi:HK97 family phage prohead protease
MDQQTKSIEKAGAQSEDNPFTFVLSTDDVDRVGDIVDQDGISLALFRKNPVALFAHNHRQPVGVWENIRKEATATGKRLVADLKLASHGTSRFIDELRALIEQRIVRATSIGFGVSKYEPLNPDKPYAGLRYLKTELHEASLVAVPANPYALRLKSLGISEETRREVLLVASDEQRAAAIRRAASAVIGAKRAIKRG